MAIATMSLVTPPQKQSGRNQKHSSTMTTAGFYHGTPLAGIVATILAFMAWLIFILIYAIEWSGRYTLFQNMIVTIVSLLIVGLFVALVWIIWGMRMARRFRAPW
jgi:amino acid transporter